jgi:hypothetical protein
MPGPRVFISSTSEMAPVRRRLIEFIEGLGFEAVDYKRGDIPYHPTEALDRSCYEEIPSCHIMIVLLGRRYGSRATMDDIGDLASQDISVTTFRSVVKVEYLTARAHGLQIYVFVTDQVCTDYGYYRADLAQGNLRPESYRSVDDVNVLHFIHEVYSSPASPCVSPFTDPGEITDFLRRQWAGDLRRYFEQTRQRAAEAGSSSNQAQKTDN